MPRARRHVAGAANTFEKFGEDIVRWRGLGCVAPHRFLEDWRTRSACRGTPLGLKTPPRGFILELIIGRRHFLEAGLLARGIAFALGVRVQTFGETPIGGLDLRIARVPRKPENFVRIAHGARFSAQVKLEE